jgi:hypothetical protein
MVVMAPEMAIVMRAPMSLSHTRFSLLVVLLSFFSFSRFFFSSSGDSA